MVVVDILQFFGRFHPLVVHLPIGVLLVAILFDWLSSHKQYTNLKPAVVLLYLIGAASATVSCLTGYLLSLNGEYAEQLLSQHLWLGMSVLLTSFLLYGCYQLDVQLMVKRIISILLLVVIIFTGHLGGSLTHGETYLYIHLPSPFKEWFLGPPAPEIQIENVQEAMVYEEVIVPILAKSCYRCHSEKKQKGKLRLDSPENIAERGKSRAEIIVAGNPEESELMKRIYLPKNDDAHMPPSEKDELTDTQKEILHWWIEQGAAYGLKVKELDQSASIADLLESLEDKETDEVMALYPQINVAPPSLEDIADLRGQKVTILPLGNENLNLLSVNFINVDSLDAPIRDGLAQIKNNIAWLKISDLVVNDSLLSTISSMPNLIKLYLDHTSITDQGIRLLEGHQKIRYLNLVNTPISIKGLEVLSTFVDLREVFIYKTATNSREKERLIQLLNNVVVDTGGYQVPILSSDTTFIPES